AAVHGDHRRRWNATAHHQHRSLYQDPAGRRHRRLRVRGARPRCQPRGARPVNPEVPMQHPASPSPRRGWRIPALALAAVAALSARARNAPEDSWDAAGPDAQGIHDLQWPIFLIAGVVGVIVFVIVGYAVFRFKDRGQPSPEQTHGKPWLEYLFIALPAVL